jgi:rRNA maturation endonuclease Nob1
MRKSISSILKKCSEDLNRISVETLTEEDIKNLNEKSSELIKKVRDNLETENPIKNLSDEDKILLLSFVVYKRQNIATPPTEDPNVEDSAKILHGKVYKFTGDKKEDKEVKENIDKDLIKQLSKAGLNIKK